MTDGIVSVPTETVEKLREALAEAPDRAFRYALEDAARAVLDAAKEADHG